MESLEGEEQHLRMHHIHTLGPAPTGPPDAHTHNANHTMVNLGQATNFALRAAGCLQERDATLAAWLHYAT